MTMEHSPGGATLVKPISSEDLRHRMKCSATSVVIEHSKLVKAEEKLIDEEITSVESAIDIDGTEDENYKVEQAMISVALVHSVVERCDNIGNVQAGISNPIPSCPPPVVSTNRYGLRKRRRVPDRDEQQTDTNATTARNGFVYPAVTKRDEIASQKQSNHTQQGKGKRKHKRTQPTSCISKNVVNNNESLNKIPTENPVYSPSSVFPLPTLSVPNPLSGPMPTILPAQIASNNTTVPVQPETGPLLNVQSALQHVPDFEPDYVSSLSLDPYMAIDSAEQRARVTFDETTFNRDRGFSIDLDLALGLTEEQNANGSNDLSLTGAGRDRAYSFECFAFGFNSNEPLPPLEQSQSMCTATVNEDLRRPRGDSIIFDPSSFQDGGIHELTALERARSMSIDNVDSLVDELLDGVTSGLSTMEPNLPAPPPSSPPVVQVPTISEFQVHIPESPIPEPTTSSFAIFACGTIPYEILNTDGRIGIYPPDARRDRIARFHAKRSKRVWRKRIKYDCRKKLADSRPRIKGRFVKRLDEPED